MKITIIGTLPPVKGPSDYCMEQVKALSKRVKIFFIDFKSNYPEFLYPGSTKEEGDKIKSNNNLEVRELLTWDNPFSWISAGIIAEGEIIHFHWWTLTFYLRPKILLRHLRLIKSKRLLKKYLARGRTLIKSYLR